MSLSIFYICMFFLILTFFYIVNEIIYFFLNLISYVYRYFIKKYNMMFEI